MRRRPLKTPSPAMAVASIALFVSIGGVGYAAARIGTGDIRNGAVTARKLHDHAVTARKLHTDAVTPRKIKRLAVKTRKLADLAVTTDKLADGSVTAGKLATGSITSGRLADLTITTGKLADLAVTTAKLADRSITTGKLADRSVTTDKLGDGSVTTGKFSPTAVAPDAGQLDGSPASAFQRRVTGSCGSEEAIFAIGPDGAASCRPSVFPIVNDPAFAQQTIPVGSTDQTRLEVVVVCHLSGQTEIAFHNIGTPATLNWLYSDGGTTVNASGNVIPNSGSQEFSFAGKRLEGQFIFAGENGVTTVNLHAFDGGTSCEVRGTAMFAASP